MKKYICTVCDWEYDPAKGDPDNGIAPGTALRSRERRFPAGRRISF